ncbi:nose resistant to fluoxetine protein 6-like, partial [Physella acuta]|uniref:nose resistant to fluoxetine protein 6-like n=1 Tax=Physella acuta TaxID=109671 RepID=UPI0027DB017F
MGKPGNGILQGNTRLMGNYDQCRSISGVTDLNQDIQGVFVEFTFRLQLPAGVPSASGIFPNQDTGLPVLLWGVCLPAGCDLQDATVIGKQIAESLNMTHSGSFLFEDKDPLKDTCFIIAIVVFGVLGCFCFIGTIIDVYVVNKRCKKDKKKGRTQKTDAGSDAQETQGQGDNSMGTEDSRVSSAPKLEPHYTSIREGSEAEGVGSKDVPDGVPNEEASATKKIGIAGRFFLAFSISTNLQEILAAKHSPSDIHCLHGIKVMSISWVILGHVFFLTPHFANLLTVNDMSKWWSFQGITNGVFAVDTFFLISGCLVAYLFLKTARRAGGLKWKHMVLYYVHRYLRITPLFALAMLFYTGITPYLESGPFAREAHDRDVVCRDTWWANILYITNLLDDPNACINWSWYLPNDMQFYVVAPLALIPMALGQRVIGLLVTFLLVACHFTTNAILQNKLHTSIYRNVDKLVPNIYIKPWTRVGPYAIGIILGFILFQTKCKARLKKVYVFLGWLISAAGALTIVYISYDNVKDYGIAKATWSYLSADVYETVKIPVWSLCVGWVIFACASGYG